MDTLSSSVSTASLQVPGFHSTTTTPLGLLHQFKPLLPHSNSHHHFHKSNSISKTNKPSFISSINSSNSTFIIRSSKLQTSNSLLKKQPTNVVDPILHRKASTGYAAALLDIGQCNNTLHVIEKDVRRFLKLLRLPTLNQHFVGDEQEKGEVVKEIAVQGKFQKHLVVIVKLIVEKKKQVWMVNEVLEEFQRIYGELCGKKTQVGLVWFDNSKTNLDYEHQLFEKMMQ